MSRTVRLGMFVLGALVILAVGIFLIGRQQGMFRSGYTLKAQFTNVSGLQNGAEVRVGGINEGTVKVIQLPTKPGEKVTVVMELAKPTLNVLKSDSVGAIRTEGMVGAKFVEITFGTENGAQLHSGDMIQAEQPIDFADLLKKANTIMDSTDTLTTHMASAAANLDQISAKINGGKGSLGQLVNDQQMYKQLNQTTAEAAAGATAFKDNMQALQHNFLLKGFFKKRGYNDSEELTAHEIDTLPPDASVKTFSYNATKLFDKADSPKLKDPKQLADAGQFLAANKFGSAVVVAYTGGKGDSENDKILTEARSMLVRDYLVKNFSMNDKELRTLGVGKNAPAGADPDGGVQILVYSKALPKSETKAPVVATQ